MTISIRGWRRFVAGAAVLAAAMVSVDGGGLRWGPPEAQAIVGRPLTPVSYAGVARRTVRRTAVASAAVTTAAVATAATVATLPAGCVRNGAVFVCGATSYRAVYDGPDVVYVVE